MAKATFAGGRRGRKSQDWSQQQLAVFTWFKQERAPHLVVRARAGVGKTTTIIEGINCAPEQNILLCAFNKRIAEELNTRIANEQAQVRTLHALGYAAIRQRYGHCRVESTRADDLTRRACPKDTPRQIQRLVSLLHTKARDMLGRVPSAPELTRLALFFDYVPDEHWRDYDLDWVVVRAINAMQLARDGEPDSVDFADMIYLPLVQGLLTPLYDLVVVDEAQDMTMAQLEMAQRSLQKGGRICIVGDDRQAIYGFRGADSQSIDRLKTELQAAELPLTMTYRCGQAIVERAQRLVPDIQAGPSNPPGEIVELTLDEVLTEARPGDFVLSRLNAPLVSLTLAYLRQGKRARMAGRDIGAGLIAVLRKLHCTEFETADQIVQKVRAWEIKTISRAMAYGQPDQADRARDQAATIYALLDGLATWQELLQRCTELFVDDPDAQTILCSTVHKAKGLEADRVYILQETLYRRGVTPEEQNIEYVAITRAKRTLGVVRSCGRE